MGNVQWAIRAGTAALLISTAGCGQLKQQQTAAQLVASGDPRACGSSETKIALQAALNREAVDITAITFSAADPSTRKVRCNAVLKTGPVDFEVAENLATPGQVVVKILGHPLSPNLSSDATTSSTNTPQEPHVELARARGYTFNMPDYYPAGYQLWRTATAHMPVNDRPWVRSLQGTASDVRQVSIGAEQYVLGWVCEPHNCGGNEAVVLISRDQRRSFGYVRLTDDQGIATDHVAGTATGTEAKCAKFFLEDRSDTTACAG